MSARGRILARVRSALAERERLAHPGPFGGPRPAAPTGSALDAFAELFRAAGGEVAAHPGADAAAAWLAGFARDFESACVGRGVPGPFRPALPPAPPARAALSVSLARGAVAETGSLLLGAEDGRRVQLLAPVHVVLLPEQAIFPSLREALERLRGTLPSALGLHSGPSKSADLGQVMVRGVHGPGRIVALVVGGGWAPAHERGAR